MSATLAHGSHDYVLILDFGSQYTQLIARRIRECGVYCEIETPDRSLSAIRNRKPSGLILSGGPSSVLEPDAPGLDAALMDADMPILGICYGFQWLAQCTGGTVEAATRREYGAAHLRIDVADTLFAGLGDKNLKVWMSHGDRVLSLPEHFQVIGSSDSTPFAAVRHQSRPIYGLQFHPEVVHTTNGRTILHNFVREICGCADTWSAKTFIDHALGKIKERVGEGRAVCGLSGGVDSSVAAALVFRAIGKRLTCIFVDHGLLRQGESEEVKRTFENYLDATLVVIDASNKFLEALRGVSDPEDKRKIIGRLFIEVFEEEARRLGGLEYLVQGTLYPDVIESVSVRGPSVTIKTHHNVGGLPDQMELKLVEPLRELFKDEVREVGRQLGLPERIVGRHPFPGPGLGIRVLGEITRERLDILRQADAILIDVLRSKNLYDSVWQAFAVFLPVQSVGVMGDGRTYDNVIALRCVDSVDAMTADWSRIPFEVMAEVSSRITNEVRGVNRVVYDISSKPPATIEWE